MDITVVVGSAVDEDTATDIATVSNAALPVDSPQLEPVSGRHEQLRLVHGWDGQPRDHVVLARDEGLLVGFAEVDLPRFDNTHVGLVDLQTHPDRRGEGIGDAMLDPAVELLRADSRTLLMGDAWAASHREKFWLGHGLTIGSRAAQRRLVLGELDWPRLDGLLSHAEDASSNYEIVEVPIPTPPELIEDMLRLQQVMNDAPTDDLEIEDEEWPEERLRGLEEAHRIRGFRVHRLVARRRTDGELAGHTVVTVENERPHLGEQEDTEVVPAHRGHRLGIRLKVEMLRLLRDREPRLHHTDTWNAESNTHMIAVNELLGCVVVGRSVELQKRLT